jgi:membrane-associated PAP2 superfamily phosphatase
MTTAALRSTSRRIVLELFVVALLVGFGAEFPRDQSATAAWAFLGRHPLELAHAVLGTVVVLEALTLVVRSNRKRAAGSHRALPVVGMLLAWVAAASGATYVSHDQSDSALTSMTVSWVVALIVYATIWQSARRRLRDAPTRSAQ